MNLVAGDLMRIVNGDCRNNDFISIKVWSLADGSYLELNSNEISSIFFVSDDGRYYTCIVVTFTKLTFVGKVYNAWITRG